MGRAETWRAAGIGALLALTACSGGNAHPRATVRTDQGSMSTTAAGVAGNDGSAQGVPGVGSTGGAATSAGTGTAGQLTAGGSSGAATPVSGANGGATSSGGTGSGGATTGISTTGRSGGGAGSTTSGGTGTTGTSSGTTGTATGSGTTGAVTGSTTGVTSGSLTTGGGTSGGAPFPPGDPVAFCPAERTLNSRLAALDANAPPAQLRAQVQSAWAAFGPALDTAPPVARSDVVTVTNAYGGLFAALDQAGYDVSRVSLGAIGGFSPTDVNAAADRLVAYVARNC